MILMSQCCNVQLSGKKDSTDKGADKLGGKQFRWIGQFGTSLDSRPFQKNDSCDSTTKIWIYWQLRLKVHFIFKTFNSDVCVV